MGFIALIRRELANAFLHDARRAIFLFGAATAYLILFGILYYPGVVKEIPTVVCDEEHTAYSRLLTRQVDDDERLGLVRVVADEGEARDMLRRKEVYAAVIIPADFSHDILNGRSAKVLFMLNGANIITTNIATTAGNDIVNTFNTRFAARQAALRTSGDEQMLKKRISPVETTLRVLNNPTQSYMMFFMVGLAMAAMQQGIFLAVGAAVQGDFKDTEGLKGAPKAAVLVVKVAVYWLLSVLSFALVCVISYGLGIPDRASVTALLTLASAFSFAAVSLGLFASSLFHNELQFVRASIMYTVPAFIFGGYTWPLEAMDPVTQVVAQAFPMAWMSNAVRELFLSGHLATLSHNLTALTVMGVIFLSLGSWIFLHKIDGVK
ncbi:multidrug ABC transporter permease [Megasphaera sp. BL7]|jgi:ABC-2 type transport system permease protein|uniref:ABC transporter permease n=1 Tax=unclassified Megasphaera TaxID=2626256 RepID=UPI000357E4EA|nr:ABC transporter permease [Megasphaera sp. BL7]EPP15990.1 multidrug ABC transporter permease [Megasphaera sp. BL7]